MCKAFNVSKSSYYFWEKESQSERKKENINLTDKIIDIFKESRETYGIKRIQAELLSKGISVGHNRVAKIKRENNIYPKMRRKYKQTTDSKHNNRVNENLLNRDFVAEKPNEKWVSDITYISTMEGWLYLSSVIDLHSRKVIGWSMDDSIDAELVCSSIDMALLNRKDVTGCIFHSDRGSQYTSDLVRKKLSDFGFVQSMSRKGNCWDNAVAESFFKTLKYDGDMIKVFKTKKEAKECIFEFIEVFYNRKRRHSSIGYFTPEEFDVYYCNQVA